MKLRIQEKYPYHDTHCGGAPQPNGVFIFEENKEFNVQLGKKLYQSDNPKTKTLKLNK